MEFNTIWTNIGKKKLANKIATGQRLTIVEMALGDGGKDDGSGSYQPKENQTSLKREKYRTPVSAVEVDSVNLNWFNTIAVIPANVGGFFICEGGLYDDEGDLVVIANIPVSYKPQLEEGSSKDLSLKIATEISNTSNITMKINPNVVTATVEQLNGVKKEVKAYADEQLKTHSDNAEKHITELERNAWNDKATSSDVSQAKEEAISAANNAQTTADNAEQLANAAQNTANEALGKANSIKIYHALSEINASYTEDTPLRTVLTAMQVNSELHCNITKVTADYPEVGILHITKTAIDTASMKLDSTTRTRKATVTPATIEQIFGGGGGINWKLIMNNDDFQTLDTDITSLETEMVAVKKSVSDGKTLVAAAVTRKDVQTAATDSFATIASNIDSITTVEQATADATAVAGDILVGKTAYVNAQKVVGTMPDIGAPSTAIANGVLKQGHTSGGTIANLVAGNVKQGVNIGGIVGNLKPQKSDSGSFTGSLNSFSKTIQLGYRPNLIYIQRTYKLYGSTYRHNTFVATDVPAGTVSDTKFCTYALTDTSITFNIETIQQMDVTNVSYKWIVCQV